jgi:hypothetical protein
MEILSDIQFQARLLRAGLTISPCHRIGATIFTRYGNDNQRN